MKERELIFIDNIDEQSVKNLMMDITALLNENNKEDIILFISSMGGSSGEALAFYDWVKFKKINLTAIALGKVYSTAIILFLAGNNRKATINSAFLIHGLYKKWKDVAFTSAELRNITEELELSDQQIFKIIEKETKFSTEELLKAKFSDILLTSEQALEKSLIKEIIYQNI